MSTEAPIMAPRIAPSNPVRRLANHSTPLMFTCAPADPPRKAATIPRTTAVPTVVLAIAILP